MRYCVNGVFWKHFHLPNLQNLWRAWTLIINYPLLTLLIQLSSNRFWMTALLSRDLYAAILLQKTVVVWSWVKGMWATILSWIISTHGCLDILCRGIHHNEKHYRLHMICFVLTTDVSLQLLLAFIRFIYYILYCVLFMLSMCIYDRVALFHCSRIFDFVSWKQKNSNHIIVSYYIDSPCANLRPFICLWVCPLKKRKYQIFILPLIISFSKTKIGIDSVN